jgi:hypothetical protein
MKDAYEAYAANKGSPVTFGALIQRFYTRFPVYQISDDLRRYTFEYNAEKVLKEVSGWCLRLLGTFREKVVV